MSSSLPILAPVELPALPANIVAQEWTDRAAILAADATSLTITNPETYAEAADLLKAITGHSNGIEKERTAASKPVNDLLKEIKRQIDTARAPLETSKALLQRGMVVYADKERRKAEEEARRKAEEQAELARLSAELLGPDAPAPEPEPEALPAPVIPAAPVSMVTRLVIDETLDIQNVPAQFLQLNTTAVNAYLRDRREEVLAALNDDEANETKIIPGLRIKAETKPQSR